MSIGKQSQMAALGGGKSIAQATAQYTGASQTVLAISASQKFCMASFALSVDTNCRVSIHTHAGTLLWRGWLLASANFGIVYPRHRPRICEGEDLEITVSAGNADLTIEGWLEPVVS